MKCRAAQAKNINKGFTLIELLVVISIIAVLMSILMPALGKVKKQARTVLCQTNLKQWSYLFHLYSNDNKGKFCPTWNWSQPDMDWHDYLRAYSEDGYELMLCPEATKIADCLWFDDELVEGANWSHAAWVDAPNYQSGDKPIEDYDYGSYTYNSWATTVPEGNYQLKDILTQNCWRTAPAQMSNNVPIILDGKWPSAWVDDTDVPSGFTSGGVEPQMPWSADTNNMDRVCTDRHYGYVVSLFADGSSRKIGLKELWMLKWHKNFDTHNNWATDQSGKNWPDWMSDCKDYN